MTRRYYWDSGVFVAYFNDEPNRADTVESLLNEAQDGNVVIVTSSFAFVEVLKIEGHVPLTKQHEEMIVEFFQYPFIKIVDATRGVCEAARHLIWKHSSLKPKDAVHLASALAYDKREHLDGLFSYDADFTNLHGVITQKFPIVEPFVEQLNLLPSSAEGDESAE